MVADNQNSLGNILVVDDDDVIRDMVEEWLATRGYSVTTASDGNEALGLLDAESDAFDLMILDRNMPNLDGLGVLHKLQASGLCSDLPVVMLTTEARPESVAEGVKAGAYYYVTKPCDEMVLLNAVAAAHRKFRQFRNARNWGIEVAAGLAHLTQGRFEFHTPHEGVMIANLIANLAESPSVVLLGLMELITNAIENGNLGIDSEDKKNFFHPNDWSDEVYRRLHLPENLTKKVTISFEKSAEKMNVAIQDEGCGFDWLPFLNADDAKGFDPHGRGITIAKAFCFQELSYNHNGTCAVASFRAAAGDYY